MQLTEFEKRLDQFGGDLARWPTEDATSARALLQVSGEAQSLLQRATAVEALLIGAKNHAAPDYLAGRIMANLPDGPFDALASWLTRSLWRTAATALLPLAIGFSAGTFSDALLLNTAENAEIDGLIYIDNLEVLEFDEF